MTNETVRRLGMRGYMQCVCRICCRRANGVETIFGILCGMAPDGSSVLIDFQGEESERLAAQDIFFVEQLNPKAVIALWPNPDFQMLANRLYINRLE